MFNTPLFSRVWTLTIVLASVAFSEVPSSMVKIIIDPDQSQGTSLVKLQNTGDRPIKAVIFRLVTSTKDRANTPYQTFAQSLPPGAISPLGLTVPGNLVEGQPHPQISVAALVFSDGTHIGTVTSSMTGNDAVYDLFQYWQGEADAFAFWKSVVDKLPKDGAAFMAELARKIDAMPGEKPAVSEYQGATETINRGIKATFNRTKKDIARGYHASFGPDDPESQVYDVSSAREFLINWIAERAAATKQDAIDAGEAK